MYEYKYKYEYEYKYKNEYRDIRVFINIMIEIVIDNDKRGVSLQKRCAVKHSNVYLLMRNQ